MDKLEEFNRPVFEYERTGIIRKNIAGVLDAGLVLVLANLTAFYLIPEEYVKQYFTPLNTGIYFFGVFILYRLTTILLLTSTIGMRILKFRYMTESTIKLTTKEKIFASFMIYINGVRNYNLK
jgi:uncharacterized RDD family membrane protein YckC